MDKRRLATVLSLLALSGALCAQAVLVLEPQVRVGGGSQDYSYTFEDETRIAEGSYATIFAWLPGLRVRLQSYKRLDNGWFFPIDPGLGAFYQFTKAGEFFDTLDKDFGRYINLHSLHLEGFASYSFKSELGFIALDLGGFYDLCLGGGVRQRWTLPLSTLEFPGWYGIHLGAAFEIAFQSRSNGYDSYPALLGAGLSLNLDIALNDLSTLEEERLKIVAFTVGFAAPWFI